MRGNFGRKSIELLAAAAALRLGRDDRMVEPKNFDQSEAVLGGLSRRCWTKWLMKDERGGVDVLVVEG